MLWCIHNIWQELTREHGIAMRAKDQAALKVADTPSTPRGRRGSVLGALDKITGAGECKGRGMCTSTMRVELIGHFKSCLTEIYLHI